MKMGTHTPVYANFFNAPLPPSPPSPCYQTQQLTYISVDIKPDNILVNYGTETSRFADVQLADFGDVTRIDTQEYLKIGMDGPHMGAAIFRSPEAMMQLRWGQSTDIWSFGATVSDIISLRVYSHVFVAYQSHLGPQLAYVQA